MKRILDWNKYIDASARAVAEGVVLLKNDGALPLKKGGEAAVFGRIQLHYYKSGTGSGGMEQGRGKERHYCIFHLVCPQYIR